VGGETFLCDPGRGLYDLYRRYGRAQNVFCNSYGHSQRRIGRRLQSSGREFGGKISLYDTNGPEKRVTMTIGGAYQVPGLARVQRSLRLAAHGERAGDLIVKDVFTFSGALQPIEEALVTWLSVEVSGATAVLTGETHKLQLTPEHPRDAVFSLQVMKEESKANLKDGVLKRLSYEIGPKAESIARIRATVLPL